MITLLWIIGGLLALLAISWVLRKLAQVVTGNKPRFRDMPLAVALGYVLGVVVLAFGVWLWFQPNAVFFRWFVQGLAISVVAAFIFRWLGRTVGTKTTKKAFRQMPLTASFGFLVILIYAICAIFAGVLAPYGQAEVFQNVNVLPGGNPATGGDPAHLLGTDQIGRDLLTRLIYGAQNTVGIAFITTLLAFFIGGSLGEGKKSLAITSPPAPTPTHQ